MKEKYVIVFIIGIVFLLLVGTIGFMNAQEEQEIPTEVGDTWLDRIISNIQSFFHKQDMFTIYGRELSCSITPDMVHNFVKDQKYYFSEESTSKDFFVNFYRGERGRDQYLKEIYYYQDQNSAYVTDGDGQGNIYASPYITCDAGMYWDEKCYIEVYTCDKGVCVSDSDCESDEECNKQTSAISDIFPFFGVCEQEEVTYHETKVYECSGGSKDYIGEVSRGDINWCPDPDDNNYILPSGGTSGVCYESENEPMECKTPPKTCWRIQDNQCGSISIYTTSCENSGYYSSKAVCEDNIGITRNCWIYDDSSGECKGPYLQFTTKSCEEIGKFSTEQVCKDEYGLDGNGNGNGNGVEVKSFNISELIDLSSSSLKDALCETVEHCPSDSSCKIIERLLREGYVTETQMKTAREDFCINEGWWKAFWDNEKSCTRKFQWNRDDYFQTHYGLCVFGEEEAGLTKILKDIGRKIPITGDPLTDGIIIGAGGLILLFVLFSRLGGHYGEIKYEV